MLQHLACFCILILTAAPAIAQTATSCQVTGFIKGLANKPVVFRYERNGQQQRDTVRAAGGRFSYTARPSDDGTLALQIVPSRFAKFWYEPGKVSIAGSLDQPGELTVRGTPENEVLTRYNQRIGWKFNRRIQAHPDSFQVLQHLAQRPTLAFIQARPKARTSAYLLTEQTKYDDQPEAEYTRLAGRLSPAVQASAQGRALSQRLVVLRNQPIVGRRAPAFSIPDTAGVQVTLSRFQGQYVLLDFWGHWCGPCIRSMPHLKQLQTQYARQVAVVGIGMEHANDKRLWLQAIRKHQATWTQLSEFMTDGGVIAQYNITAFPTYLLLDQQGVVIARANELGPIETKLKTLILQP